MSEPSLDLVPNLVRRRKSNGRCVYDKAAKRELVRRCLLPGVSLARTALEHGLNANLLRKWVVKQTGTRLARRGGMLASVSPVALLPVMTRDRRRSARQPLRTVTWSCCSVAARSECTAVSRRRCS